MAKTINYDWDLPSPGGLQLGEIAKIATTFTVIDVKLKSFETALSTHKHAFADLTGRPTTLGGFGITDGMTADEVAQAIKSAVDNLVNGSGEALDTLKELADALGNDPNFAASVGTALGVRVRVDTATNFSLAQRAQGRANIDALGTVDKGAAGGVASLDAGGKVPAAQLPALTTTATVGAAIAGSNGKVTPADGDFFTGIEAGGSTMFKTTWANIKAVLQGLFDGRYLALAGGTVNGTLIVKGSLFMRRDGWQELLFQNDAGTQYEVTVQKDANNNAVIARRQGGWLRVQSDGLVVSGVVQAGNGSGVLYQDGNLRGSKWGGGYLSDWIEQRCAAWAKQEAGYKAGVYTGSDQNETSFPVGHVVGVQRPNSVVGQRNQSATIYLNGDAYSTTAGGSALAGVYRCRGGTGQQGAGAGGVRFIRGQNNE